MTDRDDATTERDYELDMLLHGNVYMELTPDGWQRIPAAQMVNTHSGYCRCPVQCGKGDWHTQPTGSPWRLRDKLARLLRYHCWDCWRSK